MISFCPFFNRDFSYHGGAQALTGTRGARDFLRETQGNPTMSRNIKQTVPAALKALVVLFAILFFSIARAQMNDSGGGALSGDGGLDPSGGAASGQNYGVDSDSQNGAVSNPMRRGCVDPGDPNAADSGLPPCTSANSDTNSDSEQPAQAGPSTLSGGLSAALLEWAVRPRCVVGRASRTR